MGPTKIDTVLKAITDRIAGTLPSDTVKNPKLGNHQFLSARSYPTMDPQCSTQIHSSINTITIHPKQQSDPTTEPKGIRKKRVDSRTIPTLRHTDPSVFIIMRRKLDPRENPNGGISNFTGRIKGMHVFVGNFTYVVDFMIVEDISSIIDPRVSQVVLGRPFIEISNTTHDLPEGVVRFPSENNEVAYKMPHKIEQYNSLTDLEKEHTKSVYLRNEEEKEEELTM
ncbi:hypothetical protein Tco_0696335 [Tanacetum coccineum]